MAAKGLGGKARFLAWLARLCFTIADAHRMARRDFPACIGKCKACPDAVVQVVNDRRPFDGAPSNAIPFNLAKHAMDDYEKYKHDCDRIRQANKRLLDNFEAWLSSAGLSEKTIRTHLSNIDFYINEYLLYEEATEAEYGVDNVDEFLGYWFIKKAMWANRSSIKGNAASLKKFYTFMLEKGLIDKESLTELKKTISKRMPKWLATLERYDNLDIDDVW